MKELLKKTWFSSQDPEKISLTVKSLGSFAVAFGLFSQTDSDALAEAIAHLVASITMLVSSAGIVWGIIRKFLPKKA